MSRDKTPPLYFIDEHLASFSDAEMLWISNIAYVKIIKPYFGARNETGNLGVAVSIYLKKGDDLFDHRLKTVI